MTGLLHLVRHGQTTANVAKALDTILPGAALTAEGEDQARRYAAERPGAAPAVLLSSAARRAQQTAGLIGTGWSVGSDSLDGVHEVQAGHLEGRNGEEDIEAFRDVVRRWYEGEFGAALPGGESADELLERYLPQVEHIRDTYLGDGDAYLVSHGAAIRLAAYRLTGVDGAYVHRHPLPNTGEIVLRPPSGGGRWELVSWTDAPRYVDPMG